MSELFVRHATAADINDIVRLDHAIWTDRRQQTSIETIRSRIHNYEQGVIVCMYRGQLAGYGSVLLLDQLEEYFSWSSISGDGTLSTHSPTGRIMYGVSLSVLPGTHRSVGEHIFAYAFALAEREGCSTFALGSRVPGFKKWLSQNPKKSIEEYLAAKLSGHSIDPELRLYGQLGFTVRQPLKDYFPDEESCDYGVLITKEL